MLTERLGRLNEDLTRKIQARNEYDAVIGETEAAYMKVRCSCAKQRASTATPEPLLRCSTVAYRSLRPPASSAHTICPPADPGVLSDVAGCAQARGRVPVQARRPAAVSARSAHRQML